MYFCRKLTEETFPSFTNDINMAWDTMCSRNRGVFVTNPPDGHTYGCGNLPSVGHLLIYIRDKYNTSH